jgi:hypothetical protein
MVTLTLGMKSKSSRTSRCNKHMDNDILSKFKSLLTLDIDLVSFWNDVIYFSKRHLVMTRK